MKLYVQETLVSGETLLEKLCNAQNGMGLKAYKFWVENCLKNLKN